MSLSKGNVEGQECLPHVGCVGQRFPSGGGK